MTMTLITAQRYHDFSYGHRVVGHENKCRLMHGHNGRVHFTCAAEQLDDVGRVVDFGVIKDTLCAWVEEHWDHKFLMFRLDPYLPLFLTVEETMDEQFGIVEVDFNPTAENMAAHLLHVVGPRLLKGTGVTLIRVQLDETRKCGATVEHDHVR